MRVLKFANLLLGALGGISGAIAACYWWKASRIPIEPAWGNVEPVEAEDKTIGWTIGTLRAFTDSSKLNERAARWTAISVLLSTASCFLGGLA